MFSGLGLLSFIELCIFLCPLVLFTLVIYLSCRRVSIQRPDWRVIYCNGLFPTRTIVKFLINL